MNASRRGLLALAAGIPFMSGCHPEPYFDIEWDEEVQLLDGRVILVHFRHRYERLGRSFTRYGGTNITRDTEMSFDAGGGIGIAKQLFMGFHPMFLDQHEGSWYAVLYGSYYGRSRQTAGQDWGELEGPYGQWAIKLVNGRWQPMSMSRLPAAFQTPNILILKGTAEEHAQFAGRRVTLQDKAIWLKKHPYDYGDIELTRPTRSSPKRPDALPLDGQGGGR